MLLSNVKQLFLFIFVCLIAMSCDGDSHDHGEDGLVIFGDYEASIAMVEIEGEEHHHDDDCPHATCIFGFQLELEEGEEDYIYRQLNTVVDGEITVSVGEIKEFSIHFLDTDGNYLEDDHGDEEHCEDLSETQCGSSDHCEWHANEMACEDKEHGMHIEIEGVSVGTMKFQIRLMHNGHPDFTSLEIEVNVVE